MTWRPSSWATYGAVKKLVASAMVSDKKIDRRALSPGAGARHRFAGAVPTCCCGGGELPGAHSTADPASASAHRILNLRRQLRLLLAFALAPTPARCGGPRQPHVCYMSCTQIYIYIYQMFATIRGPSTGCPPTSSGCSSPFTLAAAARAASLPATMVWASHYCGNTSPFWAKCFPRDPGSCLSFFRLRTQRR